MCRMQENSIRELDTVALIVDLPTEGLTKGSVGTVVQVYSPGDFEVEFVGNDGRTYALSTLKVDQLLRLNFDPTAAA
jgi:hypothetical protein